MKALITVISVAGIAIAAIACVGPSAAPPTATDDAMADAPAPVVNPIAEPDDEIEVFASDRDGDNEIYSRNADGVEKQLTDNDADDISPALSPDGASIIFASNEFGDYDIQKINADGSNQSLLTTDLADDISPAWSHDGAHIAFVSDRHGDNDIFIMNADGSNQQLLTTNLADDISPSWSDDGARIIFSSDRNGAYEIYSINVDGTDVTQVTGLVANTPVVTETIVENPPIIEPVEPENPNLIKFNTNAHELGEIYENALDRGVNLWREENEGIGLDFEYSETDFELAIVFVEWPASSRSRYLGVWCENGCDEDVYNGRISPFSFSGEDKGHDEILVAVYQNVCVADYYTYTETSLSITVAHEIGHHLGLDHHTDPDHLMYGHDGGGYGPFDDLGYNIPRRQEGLSLLFSELEDEIDELNEIIEELTEDRRSFFNSSLEDGYQRLTAEIERLREDRRAIVDKRNQVRECLQ